MTAVAVSVYAGLLLARIGAFVAVLPPFAARTPRTIRAAVALALTAFYAGSAAPNWDAAFAAAAAEIHPVVYAVALLREALIGAAMGFAFALLQLPARVAGEFVSLQIGLAVSPSVGPAGSDAGGPLTNIFETTAALLFLAADGHHLLFGTFHASFAAFPLGGSGLPQLNPMIGGLTVASELGLLVAAPLAVCLFLLSVVLAIMTRAAPQLNVYSVGFTLQVFVALFGTLFLLPELVRALLAAGARTGTAADAILRGG